MKRAIRALLICGAILCGVDALISFILSIVFFTAATTVSNGGTANFGGMSATSISSVAIVLLLLSFFSVGALIVSVFTLIRQNKILYIVTLVLCVLSGFVAPGIVGCILGILLMQGIIKEEQSN